ncbi:MAG: MBL fold metallo-hydrolase [Prevotella sp.]|nr:MBL fold metallo-hydrolase [Prevotella sp.]
MLRFISFGSGSSGNCYYLSTATDGLIIDIGVGIRTLKKQFREYGISLNSVRHIFVTHDHADHIKSVGSFSHDYHVPVYATRLVHQGIDHNYCVQRKVAEDMKMVMETNKPVQVGEFLVRSFPVPHDASENVGYEIQVEGVTFVIITDMGSVTEDIKEAISRANYLVIEANHDIEMLKNGPYPEYLKKRILSGSGHLSNTDCGHALAENITEGLRHVWLCHLSEENNHPELARKTVETILRSYGIIPGKDINLEVLRRKTPTGIYELI